MAETFYADNDFDYTVPLEDVNQTTAHHEPVTAGAVAAWIVVAGNKEAAEALDTPADPGLVATCTHVGVDPVVDAQDQPLGTWLIHLDRTVLTRAIVDPLFPTGSTTAKPYLIVDDPAGARVVVELKYVPVRLATVTAA